MDALVSDEQTPVSLGPNKALKPLHLLLVSEECVLCDALAAVLERDPAVATVSRVSAAETIALGLAAEADAALVCAVTENPAAVRRLRRVALSVPIIACALKEEEEVVITWAESGVTGYVAVSTRLSDLVDTVRQILLGEQRSSPRIVAALFNRFAAPPRLGGMPSPRLHQLTRRERQIAELIAAERGDKEIARLLNISLATTKFHVHNLLRKLGIQRRSEVVDALPEREPQRRR